VNEEDDLLVSPNSGRVKKTAVPIDEEELGADYSTM